MKLAASAVMLLFLGWGCAGTEPVAPAAPAATPVSPSAAQTAAPAGTAQAQAAATGDTDAGEPPEEEAPKQAGIIGLLRPVDPNAPKAPWAEEGVFGADPLSAKGTIGHGAGSGEYGSGPGKSLSAEAIRKVVRQSSARFRQCYEKGLAKDPKLEGKVVVQFVIQKDGSVGRVSDTGSTMPDKYVTSCVTRAFRGLSFPVPEGAGISTVTYPLVFKPGDDDKPAPAQSATPAKP
jgi:hypothetical protein